MTTATEKLDQLEKVARMVPGSWCNLHDTPFRCKATRNNSVRWYKRNQFGTHDATTRKHVEQST